MALLGEKDKAINFVELSLEQFQTLIFNIETIIRVINTIIKINDKEGGFKEQNKSLNSLKIKLLQIKQKDKLNDKDIKELQELINQIKANN